MPQPINKREVNVDAAREVEVLNIANQADDSEEGEDENEDEGDDVVIPPVDDEDESADTEEESNEASSDETAESSPAEDAQAADDDEEENLADESEPPLKIKPVEGETPKEKALRLENLRLRNSIRDSQKAGIAQAASPSSEVKAPSERLAKLREQYTPEELENLEAAVDIIAESKGYVKKDATYAQQVNDVLEVFIEAHPEYKTENDVDDTRWGAFTRQIESGVYNLTGKTPKQIQAIYARIHRDVVDELGEPETKPKASVQKPRDAGQIAAQRQKIKSVSHSGGGKTTPQGKGAPKASVDPVVKGLFKGFDEGELD